MLFKNFPFEQSYDAEILLKSILRTRFIVIEKGTDLVFVNLLNSMLKIYPNHRRKLSELDFMLQEDINNKKSEFLEMDFDL